VVEQRAGENRIVARRQNAAASRVNGRS